METIRQIDIPDVIDLRARREALGLTQDAMAERLGIIQCSLSAWETGRKRPDIDKLPDVAAAYGCTVGELVDTLIILRRRRSS